MICLSSTIHVDTEVPTFDSCPSSQTNYTDVGESFATINITAPTASDNVNASVDISLTPPCNYMNGSTFATGNTTVCYVATDDQGNTASCSYVITVLGKYEVLQVWLFSFFFLRGRCRVHSMDQNSHCTTAEPIPVL